MPSRVEQNTTGRKEQRNYKKDFYRFFSIVMFLLLTTAGGCYEAGTPFNPATKQRPTQPKVAQQEKSPEQYLIDEFNEGINNSEAKKNEKQLLAWEKVVNNCNRESLQACGFQFPEWLTKNTLTGEAMPIFPTIKVEGTPSNNFDFTKKCSSTTIGKDFNITVNVPIGDLYYSTHEGKNRYFLCQDIVGVPTYVEITEGQAANVLNSKKPTQITLRANQPCYQVIPGDSIPGGWGFTSVSLKDEITNRTNVYVCYDPLRTIHFRLEVLKPESSRLDPTISYDCPRPKITDKSLSFLKDVPLRFGETRQLPSDPTHYAKCQGYNEITVHEVGCSPDGTIKSHGKISDIQANILAGRVKTFTCQDNGAWVQNP